MTQNLSATGEGARLRVAVLEADGRVLRLAYAFRNDADANAYVFNRLYTGIDPSGTYKTSANRINVEVAGGRVLLSKKIVPVPPNTRVEVPVVPVLTRVSPGEEMRETLSIGLPLRPWTPYFHPRETDLNSEAVLLRAAFQVGFFHAAPGGDAQIRTVPTLQGPAPFFPLAARYQKQMEVVLPAAVPVLAPRITAV